MARVLAEGDLEVHGRIMPASNATYFGEVVGRDEDGNGAELRVECVYKPVAGERPLWDFPHGTLAQRERAAYLVSEALGWDIVPLTLLRDGPAGPGMVQLWREPEPDVEPVDLCPTDDVPPGYRHVLDAMDDAGRRVSLVHEDTDELRRMAVVDILVNNADRKGGHVLYPATGSIHGVDHGVSFHVENKLRTVLWGWTGKPLIPEAAEVLEALLARLEGDLGEALDEHLTITEVQQVRLRARRLLRRGRFPDPPQDWPAIPWPPV